MEVVFRLCVRRYVGLWFNLVLIFACRLLVSTVLKTTPNDAYYFRTNNVTRTGDVVCYI